jgi:hypothetical protein
MFFQPDLFYEFGTNVCECTMLGRMLLYVWAEGDFNISKDLLDKWQIARPKLRISQDRYATKLVLTMIAASERAARFTLFSKKERYWREVIAALRVLLEMPPSCTPFSPTRALHPQGLSFESKDILEMKKAIRRPPLQIVQAAIFCLVGPAQCL